MTLSPKELTEVRAAVRLSDVAMRRDRRSA